MTHLGSVVAAAEPDRIAPWQFLGLVALAGAAIVMGVLAWTGRLKPGARYQSFYGGMAAAIPGGLGFLIIVIGLGLRDALGKSEDWWLWWVLSIAGFALILLAFLYMAAYYWIGVPDALRPRPQRGQVKPPPLLGRQP